MPGIAFFLSCVYKREELYFRIGIFVSAASMAGAFGGLLATGLARIPRWGVASPPIHTWRNIFFFEGLITIFAGLAAPIFMPQSPETCKFLTPREQYIASERLIREHKTDPKLNVKPHHIKRAIFNVNNIVAAGGFFCINVTVQGISGKCKSWFSQNARPEEPKYHSLSLLRICSLRQTDTATPKGNPESYPRGISLAVTLYHRIRLVAALTSPISVFMPTILKDNGWTATKAQLYSVPPYVCACIVAIAIAFVSDKTKMRGIYLACFTLLGITGFSILRWNQSNDNRRFLRRAGSLELGC